MAHIDLVVKRSNHHITLAHFESASEKKLLQLAGGLYEVMMFRDQELKPAADLMDLAMFGFRKNIQVMKVESLYARDIRARTLAVLKALEIEASNQWEWSPHITKPDPKWYFGQVLELETTLFLHYKVDGRKYFIAYS